MMSADVSYLQERARTCREAAINAILEAEELLRTARNYEQLLQHVRCPDAKPPSLRLVGEQGQA